MFNVVRLSNAVKKWDLSGLGNTLIFLVETKRTKSFEDC